MTEPIDFTDCERLPGRAYNGANGKKIAVRYDDDYEMHETHGSDSGRFCLFLFGKLSVQ